ncbi:uncharacterized protein LOC128669622 [Plodia interpunctella]|uniref:uncharacterized protein LOC128669622 n=1 Tax=Plodia interpunctella TaxID=58824 RepID=UPI002367887D|nr:uncharacterized protein LOC128669622 [Plodia interpunctella]
MFWLLLFIGMCIPCWSAEATACTEDSHCPVDYYCELEAYSCRQCLRCEDFKQAPPPATTPCVKSMVECGGCLEQKDDGNNYGCGPKTKNKIGELESDEIRLPVYAWVLLVLIVVVIIGGAVLISVINKATYAAVSRSESQIPGTNGNLETWSSPPAYNAVFNIPQDIAEEPPLYVKPSAPSTDIRESADRQATRPFDPPNYIRGPQLSAIPTPDRFSIHEDRVTENSVDGVISLRTPLTDVVSLPTGTVSNIAMEECPNGMSRGIYERVDTEVGDAALRTCTTPVVVVNNNLHVQSVSVNGTSVFIPQATVQPL